MNIIVENGQLKVDGVVQSVYPPPNWGYWKHMVPDFEPKKVLMLGVGGGTIAKIILDKWSNSYIWGIENSDEIFKKTTKQKNMTILRGDAFKILKNIDGWSNRFDLIIVDLWNGGWYPTQVFKPAFITQLKRLLTKNGKIYINAPDIERLRLANDLKIKAKSDGENIIYETA